MTRSLLAAGVALACFAITAPSFAQSGTSSSQVTTSQQRTIQRSIERQTDQRRQQEVRRQRRQQETGVVPLEEVPPRGGVATVPVAPATPPGAPAGTGALR